MFLVTSNIIYLYKHGHFSSWHEFKAKQSGGGLETCQYIFYYYSYFLIFQHTKQVLKNGFLMELCSKQKRYKTKYYFFMIKQGFIFN